MGAGRITLGSFIVRSQTRTGTLGWYPWGEPTIDISLPQEKDLYMDTNEPQTTTTPTDNLPIDTCSGYWMGLHGDRYILAHNSERLPCPIHGDGRHA